MPLSSAEKSKRYRDKLKQTDPERYNQMLKKSSERGLKRYRDKTANLNEQEKEKLRARWREDNKKYKSSSKSDQQHKTLDGNGNSQNDETARNGTSENAATSTSTKLAERNIQRRVERNLRNENADLRKTVMLLKKGYNNLFKKLETQQQHMSVINEKLDSLTKELSKEPEKELSAGTVNGSLITVNEMTPLKISEQFVQENMPNIETPRKESVRKIILEHNVLTAALKETYETSSNEDKNKIKSIVDSTLVRKYKLKTKLTKKLGLNCSFKKHKTQKCMSNRLQSKLTAFYEQDDVSRASAGKKECKTFKGCKKQKRYLLDTLCNLHKKYIKDNKYIGLSTFKKYRPFYVVTPTLKDLETCACFQHSNMQFIINALKSCGVLDTNDVNQVFSKFVCDTTFKNCMYGMCGICSENRIQEKEENSEISWLSFKLKEHEYIEKGVSKKTKKMVKEEEKGTLNELIQLFNIKIKSFKTHIFNVAHQYRQYKWCIKNLKANEIALHIDFSENWACKYKEEVQAMHFGSSKNQITLHTGVLYHKDAEKPVSFCSVCPDNTHNPEAIWAHLDPVLDYIKLHFPDVTTVHFFSDGPTTQYRQKKNFYLFSHIIPRRGFSNATWNFFEASHGKGAADGIGGAIKRTLDFKVAHGVDIPDAETAFEVLSKTETVIKLFYIAADNIKPMDNNIVTKLTPLQQTMKVHQVMLLEKYMLTHRVLSCFCENREGKCKCYDPSTHKFDLGFLTRDEATETEYGLELDETSGELRKVKTPVLIEENDKSDISIEDLVDFSNMEGPHTNTLNHHKSPIISESAFQKDTFRKRKCDEDQMLIKNNVDVKRVKKCQYGQESSEESNDDMSLHDTSSGEEYIDENFDGFEISDQGGNYIVIPENDIQGDIEKTKETKEYDMQHEKELTKDTYALVKFNLAKRNKFYLGQVLEVTGEYSYRIKFLRHKGKGKFAWPITDDISFIYRSDVEQIWSKPLSDRRGIKTFDLSKLTFNINQLG